VLVFDDTLRRRLTVLGFGIGNQSARSWLVEKIRLGMEEVAKLDGPEKSSHGSV